MKKLFAIIVAVLLTASVFGQAPAKMSYQAVIRNSSSALVTNAQVGIQISILQSPPRNITVYTETQTPTTNSNGLVTIEIGGGPGFDTINWANGAYDLKTEIDPSGGTNYTIIGTSQLLCVPYALHAKTATSIKGGITETDPTFAVSVANGITALDTANWNNHTIDTDTHIDSAGIAALGYVAVELTTHYVGELFGGGAIFYVDETGQHGLIVSPVDISSNYIWSNVSSTAIGSSARSTWDGKSNTAAIIEQPSHTRSAALLCTNYRGGDYSDWYLPAIDELNKLYNSRYEVNKVLGTNGIKLDYYSSSTEVSASTAMASFAVGDVNEGDKDHAGYVVRAVRTF